MLNNATTILAVADVAAAIRFYKNVLGFETSWEYGHPIPTFGAATWGKVTIMFCHEPETFRHPEGQGIWIDVEDVNGLHALHLERGAQIVSPIEDKPWGKREYTVLDPDGNRLRFAGDAVYVSKGGGEFPADIEIEHRIPTAEEYAQVAGREFYPGGIPANILERTWRGVVAIDPEGAVIGTVRIMCDAPGWYSIWDVAVLPAWQGRRIGTAMMEAALAQIREASPGALVHLFTFKHEFYERLGFNREMVHMRKV